MIKLIRLRFCCVLLLLAAAAPWVSAQTYEYRVLATTRTSTMEKEMNDAAGAGFVFASVMGGETAFGGKEVVAVMQKETGAAAMARRSYRLLATSKTSTMQKEMQQLGDEGFDYRGQTVFPSGLGGREVVVIMERTDNGKKMGFRLLATSRTSTMDKELQEAGTAGFQLVGLTVAKTALGGAELVCILRK